MSNVYMYTYTSISVLFTGQRGVCTGAACAAAPGFLRKGRSRARARFGALRWRFRAGRVRTRPSCPWCCLGFNIPANPRRPVRGRHSAADLHLTLTCRTTDTETKRERDAESCRTSSRVFSYQKALHEELTDISDTLIIERTL